MAQLSCCFCVFPCNENTLRPRPDIKETHFNYVKTVLCLSYNLSALRFTLNLSTSYEFFRAILYLQSCYLILYCLQLFKPTTVKTSNIQLMGTDLERESVQLVSKLDLDKSFLRNSSYTLQSAHSADKSDFLLCLKPSSAIVQETREAKLVKTLK